MDAATFLKKINRRRMAAIMMVLAFFITFFPVAFPITIDSKTQDYYDEVESLEPGDIVAYISANTMNNMVMGRTSYRAFIWHVCDRKAKIVFFSTHVPDAASGWQYMREYIGIERKYGYKYGVDFIIFPYLPGEEVALATIALDMQGCYTADAYGTPVSQLPLMKRLNTFEDITLATYTSHSVTFPFALIRQWSANYPALRVVTPNYHTIAAYYGTYVHGCADGSRGQSEYESMTGYYGEASMMYQCRNVVVLASVTLYVVNLLARSAKKLKIGA